MTNRYLQQYKQLRAKINVLQEKYQSDTNALFTDEDNKILEIDQKLNRFKYLFLIVLTVSVVVICIIYTILYSLSMAKYTWIAVIIGILMYIASCIYRIILIRHRKTLLIQKKPFDDEINSIRNSLVTEMNKTSNLILFIICANEHFYELISLKDLEKRKIRWYELYNLHLEAIQKKYHNHATRQEFIEYYEEWNNNIEKNND